MDRTQRNEAIGEIKQRFDRMVSAVLVDYAGLTVEAVTELRDQFRAKGVEYRVVKNTLVRQAIKDFSYAEGLDDALHGMTGVAWSYEDPSAAAKVIKAFAKKNKNLKVKAGIVEGDILDAGRVESILATMPGKDELRSQLLATFMAPAQNLVAQLQAPGQNFVYLLDARQRDES